MWQVPTEIQGFNGGLNYVNCCPNEPEPGKALCDKHCVEAEKRGIPCGLKDYSQYCSHEGITYVLGVYQYSCMVCGTLMFNVHVCINIIEEHGSQLRFTMQ